MNKYEAHELATLFPKMDDQSFNGLVKDIKANGLIHPIVIYEGQILDGLHRERACIEAKVEPQYVEYDGTDPVGFVISTNILRRHLSTGQRAMVAAKSATAKKGKKYRQPIVKKGKDKGSKEPLKNQSTTKQVAKILKISPASVKRAKTIQNLGAPELVAAVETDQIALVPAETIAKLPKEQQRAALISRPTLLRKPKKPKSAIAVDLNQAWNRSDLTQRQRFIDGIGAKAIWEATPEHQRNVIRELLTAEPIESGAPDDKLKIPDDLSVPDFLRRH